MAIGNDCLPIERILNDSLLLQLKQEIVARILCNVRVDYHLRQGIVGFRRLVRGWNQIVGGGQWRLDLHLDEFGCDLDADRRADQLLVDHRLLGRWKQSRGGGLC